MRMGIIGGDRGLNFFNSGMINMVMPDLKHRRGIAAAHARRAQHAHRCRIHAIL